MIWVLGNMRFQTRGACHQVADNCWMLPSWTDAKAMTTYEQEFATDRLLGMKRHHDGNKVQKRKAQLTVVWY